MKTHIQQLIRTVVLGFAAMCWGLTAADAPAPEQAPIEMQNPAPVPVVSEASDRTEPDCTASDFTDAEFQDADEVRYGAVKGSDGHGYGHGHGYGYGHGHADFIFVGHAAGVCFVVALLVVIIIVL
ncbi:MAG TPA: hypothetical protein VL860_11065 [Planctomycetota bacterium]|nr:hypothetical protein [Planctomycetota bacterium]